MACFAAGRATGAFGDVLHAAVAVEGGGAVALVGQAKAVVVRVRVQEIRRRVAEGGSVVCLARHQGGG